MKKLIKYLGGYAECERLRGVRAASSYQICGRSFTREELEREMLRYRIENNIFEVGDRVVLKDPAYRPHKYFITAVLPNNRVEIKTSARGFPVPSICWGLYYGPAQGLKHIILAGIVRA